METKRDLTKDLLAGCLHELMLEASFDKITIKMITDRAGLIRPTFYKHFQDKYEVLEWIFEKDIAQNTNVLLGNHMEQEAVVMFCRCLENDRAFYRKAYQMEPAPNCFERILYRYVYGCFLSLAERFRIVSDPDYPLLTRESLAEYYTNGFIFAIRSWITGQSPVSAEKTAASILYLLSHSIIDLAADSRGGISGSPPDLPQKNRRTE